MKKIMKMLLIVIIFTTFYQIINVKVSAETDEIASKCSYVAELGVNPDHNTMNCLLTEAALQYNVPPEIVKAIAEKESSGWLHYDQNGNVIVSSDNGIGIMQITNKLEYDDDLLKTDIIYNIKAGVETLNSMFNRNDLPTINEGNRNVLEHWYFAIMAYNGIKPVNSPIVKATGDPNPNAYQEQVIDIIDEFEFIQMNSIPFSDSDFQYDPNSNENIKFLTMNYDYNLPFTETKYLFETGQKVGATTQVNIRALPGGSDIGDISEDEIVTIEGSFEFEKDSNSNRYVWYPVKRSNGTTGYVASSYLEYRFQDLPSGHVSEDEIYYLADRGIINGVPNNNFGMNVTLSRWQVALMIARAKNISLTDRPDPGFTDVSKSDKHYDVIAAVVDEGYFKGTSKTELTFKPNSTLTRAEMAVVLQRVYEFPEATSIPPFNDITRDWYADQVASLYEAGVTDGIGGSKFGPSLHVTREQFAVFMARAMAEEFRIN